MGTASGGASAIDGFELGAVVAAATDTPSFTTSVSEATPSPGGGNVYIPGGQGSHRSLDRFPFHRENPAASHPRSPSVRVWLTAFTAEGTCKMSTIRQTSVAAESHSHDNSNWYSPDLKIRVWTTNSDDRGCCKRIRLTTFARRPGR